MDGYHKHEKGGQFVTYERLRAMGTNGFQEPATDFKDGKIVGTKRLFCRWAGRSSTDQGRQSQVHGEAQWRRVAGGGQGGGMSAEEMAIPHQQWP